MDNHLLEYIEIKDFKCFKDFKAEGFKRVNLIGGKNNVGKTAFMEACCVNVHSQDIESIWTELASLKGRRNNLEYIIEKNFNLDEVKHNLENVKNFNVLSNISITKFFINNKDGKKEYSFDINNKRTTINVNDFAYTTKDIKFIKFIDNFGLSNHELKEVFESVQKKDNEELLYKYINEFDESIVNFKVIGGDKPQCKTIDNGYRDINEFGDGLKHYISIICSLYACENGYLFIDEIDNGIHYTQQDRLWEIILTISKEQNVQVFATTHSKECIDSYARVSQKLVDEDISFIELGRNEGKLESIIYEYNSVIEQVSQNQEIRGW